MNKRIPKHYRAKEILGILKNQGPLTYKAISTLVSPPMTERKLFMAIERLKKKGFVTLRTERTLGRVCSVYQISQDSFSREKMSLFLKCSSEALLQPYFRYREILHNDACAMIHCSLKNHFPDDLILRDFQIDNNKIAQNIMLSSSFDRELKPDILLIFNDQLGRATTSVAFEIEKTRKSNKRLRSKLKKYSSQTRIDGVVYLCDEKRIIEALEHNFSKYILPKALRIKHYANYFLMFSDIGKIQINKNDALYGFNRNTVSLEKWISFLREVKMYDRRNTDICLGTVDCPQELSEI